VIVRFVDIGGIYYHHCLNFLFIIVCIEKKKEEINMICVNFAKIKHTFQLFL